MALIVFHAGMPKAGSTNIQEWLAAESGRLRDRGIECMRIAQSRPGDPIDLVPASRHGATSAFLVRDTATRPAVVKGICEALDLHARGTNTLVISSEAYEVLFHASRRVDVLPQLDALATAHTVRVAYYVRPQHSWLESAWLQWGFRHVDPPDVWIRRQRSRIDYLDTLRVVRDVAPNVSFDMRPFRRDLLKGGDVVSDFADIFLGVHDVATAPGRERWSNRGLPLEVALLLRGAPPGLFWASIHDNKTLYPLKQLALRWNLPETERASRAREVLHRYAHATFETANEQLIEELGWATEHFVPPVEGAPQDPDAGLVELNNLWKSTASDEERFVFYRALEQLLAAGASTSVGSPPPAQPPDSPSLRSRLPARARRAVQRARAVAATSRDRLRPREALTIAAAKQAGEGELLRLRFTNNGRPGNFDATALVRAQAGSGTARFQLAWRGSDPRRSVALNRGASELLRVAIAPRSGDAFVLLALDEATEVEARHPCGKTVEARIVVRRCEDGQVVVEKRCWLTSVARNGSHARTIAFSRPDAAAAGLVGAGDASLPARRTAPRHDCDPRVVDVAEDVGLGFTTRTFGAVVFDYDGDGWPDIFLGRHDEPAFLFRNDRGHFSRVESVNFPRADRHCAAAGDLTGDGRPDLFCVVGGDSGHGPKRTPNEMWLQQTDGTFTNEGAQPGLADPYGRGREVLLFDATGNGRLDVLVGNVSPRSDGIPSPNRLFLNNGDGQFRAAPELGLDLEYSVGGAGKPGSRHGGGNWPMGRLAALDADGNGWTDVVMCAQSPTETFQGVHLLQNDDGRGFRDVTSDVGLAGVPARDVAVADISGDGQPDLVIVDEHGLRVYLNDHGRFREAYHLPLEHAFRLAVADADGDGRNDVYVMRTSAAPGPDIPDVLLLRSGASLDFTPITLPTVDGTVRDDAVYAIDYDNDGRSEFLVLHGHSLYAAPIQLIALR